MKSSWLILVGCALLAGCSNDDHQDIRNWMQDQAKDMRGRVPPLPTIKTFPVVDYDNGGLVDPFASSKLEPERRGGGKNRPDMNRRREPLEAYPLETLKMVGMMMSGGRPVALIQADKTIYQARVGNYLGQNFGVITKITDGEITLKELIEDSNGDWIERVSTMQLQEQEAKK
ncbi:pilus assembly protein PilP [Uliginosibacterium sp. sgz301328]|uniref:pilus assembly protein PilP n=1 Tax=Uliginosibacterium sp. sgz301328 TaxID=3243764 RepID=UPI00359EA587